MKQSRQKYLYVTVCFYNDYSYLPRYICEDKSVRVGDTVLVDSKGEKKHATVHSCKYFTAETAPYPVEKTKTVISVIHRKTDFDEDMIPGVKLNKYRKWKTISNEQRERLEKLWIGDGCKRNFWYEVKTQEDAEVLLQNYGGFHDAYWVDVKGENAIWASRDGFVTLSFTNCWVKPKLELRFKGLQRLNLVDDQSPMFDCFLAVSDGKIFFADNSCFKIQDIEKITNEISFVVADELSWRFTGKQGSSTHIHRLKKSVK